MESSASAGRAAPAVLDPRRWWALAPVLLVCAAVEARGTDWGDVRTILPLASSAVLVPAFTLTEGCQSAFLACAGRPGSAWRWRSCSPAGRGSQRTSGQSRARRPMPLPQGTW
jgi:hypothetical protein